MFPVGNEDGRFPRLQVVRINVKRIVRAVTAPFQRFAARRAAAIIGPDNRVAGKRGLLLNAWRHRHGNLLASEQIISVDVRRIIIVVAGFVAFILPRQPAVIAHQVESFRCRLRQLPGFAGDDVVLLHLSAAVNPGGRCRRQRHRPPTAIFANHGALPGFNINQGERTPLRRGSGIPTIAHAARVQISGEIDPGEMGLGNGWGPGGIRFCLNRRGTGRQDKNQQ